MAPDIGGPRGRPSIPMAWASTRGKRQERARAPCGRPRRSSIARFGGGISACHHHQERHARPAVTARRSGAARSACAARLHTTWPRASPGATRSGVALGLFPAGPSSSTLAPSPLKGRVCGSCPELRTGKRPDGYAELTSFGWAPLAASSPVPPGPRARIRRDPLATHRAEVKRGPQLPPGWVVALMAWGLGATRPRSLG
jgi:hypothetical protein